MNKKMKKAVLVVGLSVGLVNCGQDTTSSKQATEFKQLAVPHFDVMAEMTEMNASESDLLGALRPDLETIHPVPAEYYILGRPVRTESLYVVDTNEDSQNKQMFEFAQELDLKPVKDFMPEREDIVIEEVSVVAIAEDNNLRVPDWRGEFPVGSGESNVDAPSAVRPEQFWEAAKRVEGVYAVDGQLDDNDCNGSVTNQSNPAVGSFVMLRRVKGGANGDALVAFGCETKGDCYRTADALNTGKSVEEDFIAELTSLNSNGLFQGLSVQNQYHQESGVCRAQRLVDTKVSVLDGDLIIKKLEAEVELVDEMECHDLSVLEANNTAALTCASVSSVEANWVEGL